MATIIGLAGSRGVGKSIIARHLVENHGFVSLHPFQGGKAACVGYFTHIGASQDEALRMVNGDLKDLPSPYLPDNQTPRYFMERFGQFMGVQMGPDWTIGREMKIAIEKNPDVRIIAESIVYEADVLKSFGAHIILVDRPGSEIVGIETDKATAKIVPDEVLFNDGSIEGLIGKIEAILHRLDVPEVAQDPFSMEIS